MKLKSMIMALLLSGLAAVAQASQINMLYPMKVKVENQTAHDIQLTLAHSSAYRSGEADRGQYDVMRDIAITSGASQVIDMSHHYDSDDYWYMSFTSPEGYFSSSLVQCDLEASDWQSEKQARVVVHADGRDFDIITPSHACRGLKLTHAGAP